MKHLHYVNTGDNRGAGRVSTNTTNGLYAVSGHKPMLSHTRDYLNSCWIECKYISNISNHSYSCSGSDNKVE